jgi:pimeloyl-ACP methyl ester carboxylesterase
VSEVEAHSWTASDGIELAYRETGEGRPVILLHGLFSDALMNWINFGHAERIAAAGFRVVMPDLRAHGLSGKPQEALAYPPAILVRDLKELIAHLKLTDFDLGGFSLGARTVVQAVGEGLEPGKAVLAGMGLRGLQNWEKRQQFFRDAIAQFDTSSRGDRHWLAIQFMKTMKVDLEAAKLLLPTFTDASPAWLSAFTMPTLVLCGTEDNDNGSAPGLAEVLPNATYAPNPGTHMSSVTKPEYGAALTAFLVS